MWYILSWIRDTTKSIGRSRVVKGSKKAIVVYVTRVRALLWPMTQIEAQYDDILKLLNEKLGTARVRVDK